LFGFNKLIKSSLALSRVSSLRTDDVSGTIPVSISGL